MPVIPPSVLKKLYVQGSLRLQDGGFSFELKNLIAPATITEINGLEVDGEPIDESLVTLVPPSGNTRPMGQVSSGTPLHFPVGLVVTVRVASRSLELGEHEVVLHIVAKEIGSLAIPVSDTVH